MDVRKWMIKKLVTITKNSSIREAIELMKKHSIRHLPVVDGSRLIGLVTEGDLRQAIIPSMLEEVSLKDIMTTNPITVSPDTSIDTAAKLIFKHKIGSLPVVGVGNRLLGIITVTDILGAFIHIMGVLKSSSRVDIILSDKPHAFEEVSRIIKEHHAEIISVGILPKRQGKKIYSFRLEKCHVTPIAQALAKHGHKVVSISGRG
ncbi:MAG TPA: CBS domain-containing protein [Syntrophaceae bacterium]|nr:CBS domain-containing protein [Syntrophaceae bacterium]